MAYSEGGSTVGRRTPMGSSGTGDEDTPDAVASPAPWGIVCLAVLIQRSSDKSAVVRAKALSHLGSVISAAIDCEAGDGAPLAFRRVRCPCSTRITLESQILDEVETI